MSSNKNRANFSRNPKSRSRGDDQQHSSPACRGEPKIVQPSSGMSIVAQHRPFQSDFVQMKAIQALPVDRLKYKAFNAVTNAHSRHEQLQADEHQIVVEKAQKEPYSHFHPSFTTWRPSVTNDEVHYLNQRSQLLDPNFKITVDPYAHVKVDTRKSDADVHGTGVPNGRNRQIWKNRSQFPEYKVLYHQVHKEHRNTYDRPVTPSHITRQPNCNSAPRGRVLTMGTDDSVYHGIQAPMIGNGVLDPEKTGTKKKVTSELKQPKTKSKESTKKSKETTNSSVEAKNKRSDPLKKFNKLKKKLLELEKQLNMAERVSTDTLKKPKSKLQGIQLLPQDEEPTKQHKQNSVPPHIPAERKMLVQMSEPMVGPLLPANGDDIAVAEHRRVSFEAAAKHDNRGAGSMQAKSSATQATQSYQLKFGEGPYTRIINENKTKKDSNKNAETKKTCRVEMMDLVDDNESSKSSNGKPRKTEIKSKPVSLLHDDRQSAKSLKTEVSKKSNKCKEVPDEVPTQKVKNTKTPDNAQDSGGDTAITCVLVEDENELRKCELVQKRQKKLLSISYSPVTCPMDTCGRTIGMASSLSHFVHDHINKVPLIEVYSGQPVKLQFHFEDFEFRKNKCLGILVYGGTEYNEGSLPAERGICKPNAFLDKKYSYLTNHLPVLVVACKTTWAAMLEDKDLEFVSTDTDNNEDFLMLVWVVSVSTTKPMNCTITAHGSKNHMSRSIITFIRDLSEPQSPSEFLPCDPSVLRLDSSEIFNMMIKREDSVQLEIIITEYEP